MVGLKTLLAGLITSVAVVTPAYAAQADVTDCLRGVVQPLYGALDAPPIAQATRGGVVAAAPATGDAKAATLSLWGTKGAAAAPAGAGCFGKSDIVPLWITVAAVIRSTDNRNTFIGRFGAVTQLLSVQYWSTTEQKWRPLVSSAFATAAPDSTQPRADYSMADLVAGEDRYYQVTDTRSGHGVAYRLKVLPSQPGRIVIETANVDAVRKWGLTIYPPDGLHTFYFLDERSPGVWAYYSITRVLPQTFLAEGHEKSYINRAVALYRHYVRLPTNAEPPPAP